ncbi:MAG: type II toxin-antitoxin system PemK/MazF family toxin [Candidatus Woesearchaeota archaeon]
MRQREIHLVPFPFSDLSQTKVRPVLVVSKDSFNAISSDVIVCAITSQKIPRTILLAKNHLEQGKLFSDSYIKPASLFKIEKELLFKQIGRVNEHTFRNVKKEILALF